jgi:hypothetical protein
MSVLPMIADGEMDFRCTLQMKAEGVCFSLAWPGLALRCHRALPESSTGCPQRPMVERKNSQVVQRLP